MTELKNSIENFYKRLNIAEERFSEPGDRSFEIIQSEEKKSKQECRRVKRSRETYGTT